MAGCTFTVAEGGLPNIKGGRGLNFNEPIGVSLTPLQQRMQEGRTEMMVKRNEWDRGILEMKVEMASWRKRSEATESAWKKCKETYEKRIERSEERIAMLEAKVASLIDIAGCECKEARKSEPKKVAIEVAEQARSFAGRVQSVSSEANVQVERKKASIEVQKVQAQKKESSVKAAAQEDTTKEKVQGEAAWLQVVNKKVAKSAARVINEQVKRALVGPKPITTVNVVYLRFHMRWGIEPQMYKEKYQWVHTVLKCIKINDEVKESSLIGNTILALYVETVNLEGVKKRITKWADGRDIFISQEEINAFAGQGRLTKEEIKEKETNRVTVLCARNPHPHMQECLLANIDVMKHEAIKREAENLRAKWQGKEGGENRKND